MKRKFACLALIASLGTLSWGTAQGTRTELYDTKRMQQEIEVMKGILGTTIGFFSKEFRAREATVKTTTGWSYGERFGLDRVAGYYLYGQGVTFVVPLSSLEGVLSRGKVAYGGDLDEMTVAIADSRLAMEEAQAEMERAGADADMRAAVLQAQESAAVLAASARAGQIPPPPPPPPKAAQAPAATPAPAASAGGQAKRSQEEVKKRLFEAQEKMKVRREEVEQRRKRLLDAVDQLKVYLLEALANHGDSLTQLKPGEYLNIIITSDEMRWGFGEETAERQVISLQKSWVTDYKAGRLSLDALKQKALQYRT
jgi:hypothetical protein